MTSEAITPTEVTNVTIESQTEVQPPVLSAEAEPGRLRTIWNAGSSALKAAAVAIEVLPTNEAICYGSFAYAQTMTNSPVVGAVVMGGTTFLVEAAGALGAADWVAKERIGDVLEKIDSRLTGTKLGFLSPKRYIPEKVSPPVEAGLALALGTVAVLEAKQREDPDRTAEQNRRHGIFTAAWLAGYCAVEGALLTKGIHAITDPRIIGPVIAGLAAMHYGVNKLKKLAARNKEPAVISG